MPSLLLFAAATGALAQTQLNPTSAAPAPPAATITLPSLPQEQSLMVARNNQAVSYQE